MSACMSATLAVVGGQWSAAEGEKEMPFQRERRERLAPASTAAVPALQSRRVHWPPIMSSHKPLPCSDVANRIPAGGVERLPTPRRLEPL